jgi:hypothetical protein
VKNKINNFNYANESEDADVSQVNRRMNKMRLRRK